MRARWRMAALHEPGSAGVPPAKAYDIAAGGTPALPGWVQGLNARSFSEILPKIELAWSFNQSLSLVTVLSVSDLPAILLAATSVLFIGLSKAGFGGGLGMLTTPLCVLAFSAEGREPSFAVGTLLPLLCAGDAFSLYHYWGKWRSQNLKYLMPGVVVGVVIGVHLIGRFSARELNIAIGVLALLFVCFQLAKEKIFQTEGAFAPSHKIGLPCGLGAGITSTFAHGAGPVVSVFLIPQRMPKEIYVGTTVLVFTWINWIKVPFFVRQGIITRETLFTGLYYAAFVPLGVWAGVWLNRRVSEKLFLRLVYLFTFLAGLQLVFGFNLAKLLQ